ncbi:Uncharacterised protein [Mycobacteroides abscessus subsp. abscessus]|nr:Uncharacterised protein [Mycobacteroides abscessus subsp. abscessus]
MKTLSLKSHYWLRVLKKNVRVKLNVKKHNKLTKTLLKLKENINGTFLPSSQVLPLYS